MCVCVCVCPLCSGSCLCPLLLLLLLLLPHVGTQHVCLGLVCRPVEEVERVCVLRKEKNLVDEHFVVGPDEGGKVRTNTILRFIENCR